MGHRAGFQYNFIRLNLECPWNLYGQTVATYSNNFVLSGAAPLADADAEPTALDLFEPIRKLASSGAYLASFSYYHPNVGTAAVHKTYTPSQHPCDASAWNQPYEQSQAEVCILAEGPTDKNTRGKQVYLRKFIHHVPHAVGDGNSIPASAVAGDPLAKWKNGAGPNLLVPIDADSGMQASSWTYHTHLYTRQFRKGKKRKVAAKSTLDDLLQLAGQLAPLLPLIPK